MGHTMTLSTADGFGVLVLSTYPPDWTAEGSEAPERAPRAAACPLRLTGHGGCGAPARGPKRPGGSHGRCPPEHLALGPVEVSPVGSRAPHPQRPELQGREARSPQRGTGDNVDTSSPLFLDPHV